MARVRRPSSACSSRSSTTSSTATATSLDVGEDGARRLADEAAERAHARLAAIDADTVVLARDRRRPRLPDDVSRLLTFARWSSGAVSARSPSATSGSSSRARRSRRSATASRRSRSRSPCSQITDSADRARPRDRGPAGGGGGDHGRRRRLGRPAAAPPRARRRGASVQGAVQAVAGTLVVTGHATVWMLVVLALVFGLADGFVIPTSQGLIPAVVSTVRLQQANALLGLSRSILGVLGPALGGVLVAAGSPGGALLVDAASFGVARAPAAARADPAARRQRRAGAVLRRAARGLERVPAADVDLDDDRLLRHRQLRVDVAVRARPARREGATTRARARGRS